MTSPRVRQAGISRLLRVMPPSTRAQYQTKPDLALTLLYEVQAAQFLCDYVAFDTH